MHGSMQVLSLVAGGELAGATSAGTMRGYFGDLFDEGDENRSADLDFEEFARVMQIIAPSFEGALTTHAVPTYHLRPYLRMTHLRACHSPRPYRSLTTCLRLPPQAWS